MKKQATLLSPREIDQHAEIYCQMEAVLSAAKQDVKDKKDELVKLCRKCGEVPAGAAKSLRLAGDKYAITAIFGVSTVVDQAVVGGLHAQLMEECKPGTFDQLFDERTSYVVSPAAPTIVQRCSKKVQRLFQRVLTTRPKDPSLKVEKKK